MKENENHDTLTDINLIQLYKSSAESKYMATFYQRYAHLVFGICLNFLGKTEAKDQTMAIFEKLLHVALEKEIRYPVNFLHTLAKNECISFLRKESRNKKKMANWTYLEKNRKIYEQNEDFERHLDNSLVNEPQEVVLKAIEQLPPAYKECIDLFYYDKMTYKQIAADLDIPVNKVKYYLSYARRKLEKIIKPGL